MTVTRRTLHLVAAMTLNSGIGHQGDLPWRLPLEMAHFNRVTTRLRPDFPAGALNATIMGRRTWESIPPKFRPLKGRVNVVLSRTSETLQLPEGVYRAGSMDEALDLLDRLDQVIGDVYVTGGGPIYAAALDHAEAGYVFLTRIHADIPCDAFFPTMDPAKWVRQPHEVMDEWVGGEVASGMQLERGITYEFELWGRATAQDGA